MRFTNVIKYESQSKRPTNLGHRTKDNPMKNFIIVSAALVAVSLIGVESAEAGPRHRSGGLSFGGKGWHVNLGGGGYHHRGYGRRGFYRPRRVNIVNPYCIGSGHYDYHPPVVVPHGNHLDVIPGHYDWHDTGHRGHGYYGRRGRHGHH